MPGVPGALTGKGGPKWPELCIKTVIRLCRPTGISQNHHPFLLTLPFVANVCRGGGKNYSYPTDHMSNVHPISGACYTRSCLVYIWRSSDTLYMYFRLYGLFYVCRPLLNGQEEATRKTYTETEVWNLYEWFVCYKNFSFASFIIFQKFVWIIVRKRLPTEFVSLYT